MPLPGLGGTLLPGRFLAEIVAGAHRSGNADLDPELQRRHRRLHAWWQGVEATCGPATGLRALCDVVAMPLFAMLGYRAREVEFSGRDAAGRLETRAGTAMAFILLPWSSHPSLAWRDAIAAARQHRTDWCFVLAPPFLSLVDTRGHASRRALDVTLPDALDRRAFPSFLALAGAAAFDATRVSPARIDALMSEAGRFQARVRDDLQQGVVSALSALGPVLSRGSSRLSRFDEALTLVYRILFLLFAESRDLVPHRHPVYSGAYSVGELCREVIAPEPPPGLWESLAAISRLSRLGARTHDLIVKPFNGALFARASAPSLEARRPARRASSTAGSRDAALRAALAALGSRPGSGGREPIAFADLGVEQLGAVYESVLDLDPAIAETHGVRTPGRTRLRHSQRRKEYGTFYTPQPLAEFVVRRTLTPLVSGASSDRILALRVVDPAMGSGAFLVAACRFLAAAYEQALVEEGRCAETDLDPDTRSDIRRLVAERCLAGVDVNPVAVQLARLSLWLTSLARGKPLGFLDHRLRAGNSLLGAAPDDLTRLSGRTPRTSLPLFEAAALEDTLQRLVKPLVELIARRDDTVEDVRFKEGWWRSATSGTAPMEPWRLACHVWCARWFTGRDTCSPAELRAVIDAVLAKRREPVAGLTAPRIVAARAAAAAHAFFHWPLEFPDVFYDESGQPAASAGFDAVIGNPPWGMLRRDPRSSVVDANASTIRFIRESGLFPCCNRGHLNLYQPFVDRALSLARPGGRIGLVLPWGLASDDGAAALRRRLLEREGLDTIVGLDNARGLFPIHRGVRFLVAAGTRGGGGREVRARFGVDTSDVLEGLPAVDDACESSFPIRLTSDRIRQITGELCRIPDVRRECDLALLDRLTREHPALGGAGGWAIRFGRELNATDDRGSFATRGLPVIEGKHISPFRVDLTQPSARIERREALRRLPYAPFERSRLGYRDVAGVSNRTSLIAAVLPPGVVTTHTLFCLKTSLPIDRQHYLCALFNSFVLNAIVRALMGGHITTTLVERLPVPPWSESPEELRIVELSTRLANGSHAVEIEAALHAAVARRYRLDASEFERVLELFPLVPAPDRRLASEAFADAV
jgi:hypothetical protein